MDNKEYLKKEKLQNIRHTLAHLLAASVRQLFPGAKNAIGPAIEEGFYQDFDLPAPITEKDFPKIEKKMRQLLQQWDKFERREVTAEEAKKEFAWNEYKVELINEFAKDGKNLTFYTSGDFVDLCKGGHVHEPRKEVHPDAFKLTKVAGAYWRGDEKNKMLTRIYGTGFDTKEELDQHLKMLEEAEKRDHRKLGQQLDLFTISDQVGKGLPLFTPKGALIRELLNDYSQSLRLKKGWQRVWSPHITKNDLYKTSGHWDKFGGELFLVKSQETTDQLVMKPMNCPHHQQIYASRPHSYKELPIKYMETTTVYRDEKAGELLGLSRVRSITQDDSHTFCTPDQIESVYQDFIDVTKVFYKTIGMKLRARLSFRDPKSPEKYLGEPELWDKAQSIILSIAQKSQLDYFVAEGEAAFYGPKIDFMGIDALGRQWQLATPQLDFVQPKRFGLIYIDHEGKEQTPVMIHFALMGSIERFLSVYIEHTAGNFPLWLSPVQVKVLPISKKQNAYSKKVMKELLAVIPDLRIELDERDESVGKKIREATMQKISYQLIIGEKEVKGKKVAVRTREGKDLGAMNLKKLAEKLQADIEKKK
jgi:threonyl-tRNA synthetase